MKIKDLILELQRWPEEHEVLMSGDPEGNDFRTLDGVFAVNEVKKDGVLMHCVIYPTDTIRDLEGEEA